MHRFDLRFCVPLVINILKSQQDGWDPFDTIGHPNWTKICFLLLIIVAFSFTSIEVPLTSSVIGGYMHLRVAGEFSAAVTLSMAGSFIFPQALFWYIYPIIIMVSVKYAWVLNVFKGFLGWLQAMAVHAPVCNIIIMSSATHQPGEEDDLMINLEGGGLEAMKLESS